MTAVIWFMAKKADPTMSATEADLFNDCGAITADRACPQVDQALRYLTSWSSSRPCVERYGEPPGATSVEIPEILQIPNSVALEPGRSSNSTPSLA